MLSDGFEITYFENLTICKAERIPSYSTDSAPCVLRDKILSQQFLRNIN